MARDRDDRREATQVVARRRKGAPRKRLSPELEALARGEEKEFRRPQKERLRDPRAVALIPGVANRDARAVSDARVEAMRAMRAWEDQAALDEALADVMVLRLWRGRSVTSMEAFSEEILEMDPAQARAAAERGAMACERSLEPLDDVAVAVWLRTEAALLEAEIDAKVSVDGRGRLRLDFPAEKAPESFDAVGRRLGPLLEDRRPRRSTSSKGGEAARGGSSSGKGRPERRGPPPRGGRPPRGSSQRPDRDSRKKRGDR